MIWNKRFSCSKSIYLYICYKAKKSCTVTKKGIISTQSKLLSPVALTADIFALLRSIVDHILSLTQPEKVLLLQRVWQLDNVNL